MASTYSIRPGEGGPFLFKGENRIGSVLRWHSDSSGLSVIAGTYTSLFYLNNDNCDLPDVERTLASSVTGPS